MSWGVAAEHACITLFLANLVACAEPLMLPLCQGTARVQPLRSALRRGGSASSMSPSSSGAMLSEVGGGSAPADPLPAAAFSPPGSAPLPPLSPVGLANRLSRPRSPTRGSNLQQAPAVEAAVAAVAAADDGSANGQQTSGSAGGSGDSDLQKQLMASLQQLAEVSNVFRVAMLGPCRERRLPNAA